MSGQNRQLILEFTALPIAVKLRYISNEYIIAAPEHVYNGQALRASIAWEVDGKPKS